MSLQLPCTLWFVSYIQARHPVQLNAMASAPMRYLALGDSYTIGEKVPPDQRWPNQLVEMLRAQGMEISNPTIIAQTGWTTRDLLKSIIETDFTGSFNLVSLLIGFNNQYQGLALHKYRPEFRSLLLCAVRFTGSSPARHYPLNGSV